MADLTDPHGRRLEYLRLSVTDRCDFRCAYCLPGGCPPAAGPAPLGLDEISRLARAFASLGVRKVRVTGGEPTLRGDLVEIVARLAAVPGLARVGLSTNGRRLAVLAAPLRRAGLTSLNVSLDSLDAARFERITGRRKLAEVLFGLEAALAAGMPTVKVNAVLLRGLEGRELDAFLELARERPLTVRFIELMRTSDNAGFFQRFHLPAAEVARALEERGWRALPRGPEDGVATPYGRPGHRGRVGLIAPYGRGFCARCDRVRVTSSGELRPCLFGDVGVPLRPLLASDAQRPELLGAIASGVRLKPAAHGLREGRSGLTANLAAIGG